MLLSGIFDLTKQSLLSENVKWKGKLHVKRPPILWTWSAGNLQKQFQMLWKYFASITCILTFNGNESPLMLKCSHWCEFLNASVDNSCNQSGLSYQRGDTVIFESVGKFTIDWSAKSSFSCCFIDSVYQFGLFSLNG